MTTLKNVYFILILFISPFTPSSMYLYFLVCEQRNTHYLGGPGNYKVKIYNIRLLLMSYLSISLILFIKKIKPFLLVYYLIQANLKIRYLRMEQACIRY